MIPDIETLIFTAYHGELTDDQRDALSKWVAASPANARLFIEYSNETRGIEIALRSEQAAQAGETIGSTGQVFQDASCDVPGGVLDQAMASSQRHGRNSLTEQSLESSDLQGSLRLRAGRATPPTGWRLHYVLAAAALLGVAALIGITAWIGGMDSQPDQKDTIANSTVAPEVPGDEEQPSHVETIPWVTASYDSELIHFTNENGGSGNQIGDMPFGYSAYSFWRRGSVVLEGPARWQMLPKDAIRLFDGLLVARSADDTISPLSFLIDQTEINLQNGEFGVMRTGQSTASIIVFEGSVEFSLASAGEQATVHNLEAGQTAILRTDLGMLGQQSSATQNDRIRFSNATGRLRYRPLQTTRSVYYRYKDPRSLFIGAHDYPQYRGKASLIRESAGVAMVEGDLANLELISPTQDTLTAGQSVDSYLLHFDPTNGESPTNATIEGMIAFDRPILVVLGASDSISRTDARYGSSKITYPRSPETAGGDTGSTSWGIEPPEDKIVLSNDRKRLFFTLQAGSNIDQFRILVEAR